MHAPILLRVTVRRYRDTENPWLGGFEAGVVSVLPAQGSQEGGVSVLLGFFGFGVVLFFFFQRLKLTSDMQKKVRKCYS